MNRIWIRQIAAGLVCLFGTSALVAFAAIQATNVKTLAILCTPDPISALHSIAFQAVTYVPDSLFASEGIELTSLTADEPELIDASGYEVFLLPREEQEEIEPVPQNAKKVSALTIKGTASQLNWKNVYTKNPTSFSIDPSSLAARKKSWSFDKKGPEILIVHTHGSEAYNTHNGAWYLDTDSFRSLDITENIVSIGEELAKILTTAGYNVLHSTTMYDQPTYSTSYSSALKGINAYIKQYPSIRVVIDVHRDSMAATDGTRYKLISNDTDEPCAQMMLVMGTGESGLSFPNWRDNLSFAIRLQKAILEKYPTLMRPIAMTKHRYNEHATRASFILEVGTDGNTLTEAKKAIVRFGEILAEYLKEYR